MKTNGIQTLQGVVGVLGRVMLCTLFLTAAFGYTAPTVDGIAKLAGTKAGLTPPWAFLGGAAILLLGSLSVAVGYKARFGALLLLAFLSLTTYRFHGFTLWTVMSAQLVTNLSLSGAMLFSVSIREEPSKLLSDSLDGGQAGRRLLPCLPITELK